MQIKKVLDWNIELYLFVEPNCILQENTKWISSNTSAISYFQH